MAAAAAAVIAAEPSPSIEGLAARLAEKARAIAEARLESLALARRGDPRRWRQAGLIWPLFGRS